MASNPMTEPHIGPLADAALNEGGGADGLAAGPERLAVARDHDVGDGQDALAMLLEDGLVGRVRIDCRRSVGEPPEMGQGVDAVVGRDDQRRVLLAVARRQPELCPGRHLPAVAVVIEPEVAPIAGPEVHDLCVREEGDVDRVVGMVMAEKDVGDGFGGDAERRKRVEDEAAVRDEARIRDDQGVAIADEGDAAADVAALADIARVDEMDACHLSRW